MTVHHEFLTMLQPGLQFLAGSKGLDFSKNTKNILNGIMPMVFLSLAWKISRMILCDELAILSGMWNYHEVLILIS